MKQDYTSVKNIYIICGKTDMRKGIDGLATLIQDSFKLDPYGDSIFLFSGWSKDRYKCLYFDGDGFAMLYKRLDNGKLQWPKMKMKYVIFPKRSSGGFSRGYLSSSQRRFSHHQKVSSKLAQSPSFYLYSTVRTRYNRKSESERRW